MENTYEQIKAELETAEARLRAAYQAAQAADWEDRGLNQAHALAERDRDMIAQALRAMPKPKAAVVDYGRCKECGAKLTKFDVETSDRAGYCYDCA